MKKLIILLIVILLNAQNNIQIFDYNTNETNVSNNEIIVETNFVTYEPKIKIALVIDYNIFKKFIPSIVNSVNAYFMHKDIKYSIKVYPITTDIQNIIDEGFKDILVYSIDKNYISSLINYSANFYIPIFNQNQLSLDANNIYFGGINYKNQIEKFIEYMDIPSGVAINDETTISNTLFQTENEFNLSLIPYEFPKINYYRLKNNYTFLNIDAAKSAQVLSTLTYKNIDTKLLFAPQINYNPLLIAITQPQDIQKVLIANSILSVPKEIEDTNLNLQTDIKFNWLNYATNVLLNKIYNKITQNDVTFMNDFNLYIFNNQINYNTKLYKIIDGAFKPIENY